MQEYTFYVDQFSREKSIVRYNAETMGLKKSSVEIPTGVNEIKEGAFQDSSFESVAFPKTLYRIDSYAFSNCKNLKEVALPDSLNTIGMGAFSGCENLCRVVLGKNCHYIAPRAFEGCRALKEVVVGEKIVEVTQNAFESDVLGGTEKILLQNPAYQNVEGILFNTKTLSLLFCADKKVQVPKFIKNTKTIGWYSFEGCTSILQMEIPQTVEWIADHAFSACTGLKTITLTKSVHQIEQAAFIGCSSLEAFKVPKGVAEIQAMTFSGCSSLKEVDIPSSVKLIKESAFEFCTSLKKVIIPKWCEIEEGAFEGGVDLHRI